MPHSFIRASMIQIGISNSDKPGIPKNHTDIVGSRNENFELLDLITHFKQPPFETTIWQYL